MVAERARADPMRPAVISGGRTVGYGELDAWAIRIAADLRAAGVVRGSRVGVLTAPSAQMIAAVLGVLRAGAAYVPADRSWPTRRVADVLTDAGTTCVVVDGGDETDLSGLGLSIVHARSADEGDTAAETGDTAAARAEDAAYVIYTSGSTGRPKGVLVTHGQLAASTLARRMVYPGEPVFLLVSPLAFDSSVAGLWGTLTAGGTLVAATADEVRDPDRLVELIEAHRVTRTLCVPSLYGVLLDAAQRRGSRRLDSLDTVTVAGESLPEDLLARHFAVHPAGVALVNEYGPTETTVWASYRRFDAPGRVSIGGPVPGTRLYVLDEHRRPVAPDIEGELYIGGALVSSGYLGRPDDTARAFLADPFAVAADATMYRTGDRARWNADGTLDFLGRHDHQVKIRGHRVELGEVESVLRTVPGIEDAVVVTNPARSALTGFVRVTSGCTLESVRSRVAEHLPAAMVPRIQLLEHFPLTFSGKVDRAALSEAAADEQSVPARSAAGHGVAAGVAAAWTEVLKLAEIPADVNFFDLGGHSLAMFQLQDALERRTGVRPSVVALFRHTTVTAQAALISAGGRAERPRPERQNAARRAQLIRSRRAGGPGEATP
jgi:amino acid adenylation domain-containing protein